MKRSVLISFVSFLFITLLVPVASMAQGSNYIVFKGGVFSPTDDLDDDDFDSGFNGEVAYGRYWGRHFVLEAGLGYYQTTSSEGSDEIIIAVVPLTATAKGVVPIGSAVEFYLGAGGGLYTAVVDADISGLGSDNDSDTVGGAHVMAGFSFFITPRFFLGIEGKRVWTGDAEFKLYDLPKVKSNLNGFMATGNIGFRF